jgi:hypothetical protein
MVIFSMIVCHSFCGELSVSSIYKESVRGRQLDGEGVIQAAQSSMQDHIHQEPHIVCIEIEVVSVGEERVDDARLVVCSWVWSSRRL